MKAKSFHLPTPKYIANLFEPIFKFKTILDLDVLLTICPTFWRETIPREALAKMGLNGFTSKTYGTYIFLPLLNV